MLEHRRADTKASEAPRHPFKATIALFAALRKDCDVVALKKPQTLIQAVRYFDPETAELYLKSIKWPDGPCCPQCGSVSVGSIKSRRRYQCREKGCRKQFSVLTGTIFEGTHLGLDKWVVAIWMIVNCRNGVSSCEIARTIGCKQQSAWHLLHRVRHCLQQASDRLSGTVEADATYVGGIVKNMNKTRRREVRSRGAWSNKTTVHAVRERASGQVRADVIGDETGETIRGVISRRVEPRSYLHTDASPSYGWASRPFSEYPRSAVNHARDEYVRDNVHVNGCENFFNCLRRAVKGTYVRPAPEHLGAYVDEAVFRFNVRNETEWDRFDAAMRLAVGKRLTYSKLTGGAIR